MRPYPRHLDWMRYTAAFLLLMYGSSKLAHLQFHMNQGLAQRPIASLTGYELTWFYYGYSRTYGCILGLTQIFGAVLLLFRKTSLLGAITMLPVIINILLIDLLILPPDFGPTIPALIICLSLLMLLRRESRNLVQATLTTQASEPIGSQKVHLATRLIIVSFVAGAIIFGILTTQH